MQITPYQNGVHSLAEGLRSFAGYFEKNNDPFLMKDAIIRLHHGLETIFKDILFQRNPIFIISDKATIGQTIGYYSDFYEGKNNYLLDDVHTINPIEALSRIEKLHFGDINKQEHAQISIAFKALNDVRNSLQHFTVTMPYDIIIKALGNLLPKSLKLIRTCYTHSNDTPISQKIAIIPHMHLRNMNSSYFADIDEDLIRYYPEALNVIASLESKYDILLNQSIRFFKKASFPSSPISLKIKDFGHVGAPPYMPEIKFEGWINGEFPSRYGLFVPGITDENLRPPAVYKGETRIEKTRLPHDEFDDPSAYRAEIIVKINASLTEVTPEKLIAIENAEDYIPFMRSPTILVDIYIKALVIVAHDPAHFIVRSVGALSGHIKITLESELYGDPQGSPSICGVQTTAIDGNNTSLELSAFLASNDTLLENHLLRINFKQAENLVFR